MTSFSTKLGRLGFRRSPNDADAGIVSAASRLEVNDRFYGLVSIGVVFAFACYTISPIFEVPLVSHDHPVHLFKARQFWEDLLMHGRLTGWSHNWSLGYPASELVPCGGELWVAVFRALTLGLLSWEATYRCAFVGAFIFSAIAIYVLGSRFFGKYAGTLAAVGFAADPGGLFQGGWIWVTDYGVWPITLSCSFVAMAVARIEDVLTDSKRQHIVLASLWVGAAIVAHQIGLLILAFVVPLHLADYWSRSISRPRWAWVRSVIPLILGCGLSSFFLLPFLSRSHMTLDLGSIGVAPSAWARSLTLLQPFDNGYPLVIAFGIVGAIRAMRLRRVGGLLFVAAAGVGLLLSTDVIIHGLHLERAIPGFAKIEWGRMVMAAKLFGAPLAAFGVVSVLSVGREAIQENSLGKRFVRWGIIATIAMPWVIPVVQVTKRTFLDKEYRSGIDEETLRDYRRFNDWATKQRRSSKEHYRIAYDTTSLVTLQTLAPKLNGTPTYMLWGTPSQQFNRYPCTFERELLEVAGVKFVVVDHEVSDGVFELVQKFGKLYVYRFTAYRKDPFTLLGDGRAKLIEWNAERILLQIADAKATSRLKLHVARYDRWEAVHDGKRLDISPATVTGFEFPYLMEVPAKNGIVEFRYVQRAVDWIGIVISWASLVALGLLAFYPKVGHWGNGVLVTLSKYQRCIRWIGIGGVVVSVGVLSSRWQTRRHLLPRNSLLREIRSGEMTVNGSTCERRAELVFECGGAKVMADYVHSSGGYHLCMTTDEQATLRITKRTQLKSFLQIHYDASSERGNVRVTVNDVVVGTIPTKHSGTGIRTLQFDTRQYVTRADSKLQIDFEGPALRCFDVTAEP